MDEVKYTKKQRAEAAFEGFFRRKLSKESGAHAERGRYERMPYPLSLLQNQAGDPGTGFGIGQRMMVIPKIETAAGCDGLKLMIR